MRRRRELLALILAMGLSGACGQKRTCRTDEDCKGASLVCIQGKCVALEEHRGPTADYSHAGGEPDTNTVYRVPVDPKRQPMLGPDDALVTIVEFSDFQCPFCRRAAGTLHELLRRYDQEVRLFFFHNPLPMHPNSQEAAEAAAAVFHLKGPKAFWKYHDLLFANQHSLDRDSLVRFASQVGADPKKVRQALEKRTYRKEVEAQKKLAAKLGVRGTPAFFINGTFLNGAQPLGIFRDRVERELGKARKLMKAKKIVAAKVYETIMKSAKEP